MKKEWLMGLEVASSVHITRVKYFKRISLVSKIFNTKIFCAAREIFLNFFATKIYLPGSLLPTCGSKKETDTINLGISLLYSEYSSLIGQPQSTWYKSCLPLVRSLNFITWFRISREVIYNLSRSSRHHIREVILWLIMISHHGLVLLVQTSGGSGQLQTIKGGEEDNYIDIKEFIVNWQFWNALFCHICQRVFSIKN